MTEESAPETKLLRSQKARLIEVLSGDADFVLQHADSRCLLSAHAYQQVKACRTAAEKVTDLLDHIIQRGPEAAQGLLELLRDEALQETFPRLSFVKDLQVNKGRIRLLCFPRHYNCLCFFTQNMFSLSALLRRNI